MENTSHAVKMILGVIVFGLALTIALNLFSQIRRTSQSFLFANEGEYSYKEENISGKQKRIVGLETVIPTIFDYYNSGNIIYLKNGQYNENTGEVTNTSEVKLYKSNITKEDIYCFNFEEEEKREESWTKSEELTKEFLKDILYTNKYTNTKSIYEVFKDKKFVEIIGTELQEDKEKTIIEYIAF